MGHKLLITVHNPYYTFNDILLWEDILKEYRDVNILSGHRMRQGHTDSLAIIVKVHAIQFKKVN